MKQPFLLFGAALLLLSSCTETVKITGGGSDHPNEVYATVRTTEGKPAPNAQISFYRKDAYATLQSPSQFDLFDSATTDSLGQFEVHLPDGVFAIEANNSDSSEVAFIQYVVIETKRQLFFIESVDGKTVDTLPELVDLQLQKSASLSGTILTQSQKEIPLQVELAGFPRTAPVDLQGRFKFNHLPPRSLGVMTLHFAGKDTSLSFNLSRRLAPGENLKLDPIVLEPQNVLLDDFEDGDGQISLASLYGDGWWYTYQQPWGVILGHPDGLSDISPAITTVDGSKALHLAMKFPEEPFEISPLAIVGFNLGSGFSQSSPSGKAFFNLSSTKSLSFMARGTGKFRVQIATKATREADGWGHFYSREYSLPTGGYQEVSIPLNSLLPPPGSMAEALELSWSEVNQQVYAIDFMFTSTAEFWIDNIKLIGTSLSDL